MKLSVTDKDRFYEYLLPVCSFQLLYLKVLRALETM